MNEWIITYLLILIIILLFILIILRYIFRPRSNESPISISLVPSIGGKITRDSCEKLGGSVENGRCIIRIQQVDREIITDIGEII